MTIRQALEIGLTRFGPSGERWSQTKLTPGQACLFTGIYGAVTIPNSVRVHALTALRRVLGVQENSDLINWNDVPGRRFEEVRGIYQKAIDDCPQEPAHIEASPV